MYKLIGSERIKVEDQAQADRVGDEGAAFETVIDAADVHEMTKAQLVDFLRKASVPANGRWKEETLRAKALEVIGGAA